MALSDEFQIESLPRLKFINAQHVVSRGNFDYPQIVEGGFEIIGDLDRRALGNIYLGRLFSGLVKGNEPRFSVRRLKGQATQKQSQNHYDSEKS